MRPCSKPWLGHEQPHAKVRREQLFQRKQRDTEVLPADSRAVSDTSGRLRVRACALDKRTPIERVA